MKKRIYREAVNRQEDEDNSIYPIYLLPVKIDPKRKYAERGSPPCIDKKQPVEKK